MLVVRGVGALAAEIVAQAAELVAVLARQAGDGASAAQASRIQARASALAVLNEQAFSLASRELDASIGGEGDELSLSLALARSVDVPLDVCTVASDLVLLCAELADGSLSARAPDLCGAAQLGVGACNAAGLLVDANLTVGPGDARSSRADVISTTADRTARRMLEDLVGA
jgi:formiminotetrahydrofolate cyclodeaminase